MCVARHSLQRILADNVRLFRLQRGWSQEEFAERCELHRTYVGAIERGERNVTLRTVERVAVAFGIRPVELLAEARR